MKIATVGKGGSGKTTLAGTLARILASDGHRLLAIDGDPNPNLALTLGLTAEQADRVQSIPPGLMQVHEVDGQHRLELAMAPDQVLSQFALQAADGISLLVMGKPAEGSAGSGCMCASHRAVRGLIQELSSWGEYTVTDMEAGLEHLKRGTARNVDIMLIVAEPYYRSLEAAARTFHLAQELGIPHIHVVANKVKDAADRDAIAEFCDKHSIPVIATVPLEPEFVEAERRGCAPLDHAPDCAGVHALRELAGRLHQLQPLAV